VKPAVQRSRPTAWWRWAGCRPWRCRESNPGPSASCQGFSERSSLCLYSAPSITRASRC